MIRRALGLILLVALASAPGTARAQSPASAQGGVGAAIPATGALVAERQRLRTELDRVNGEIDALKHESRGLRDDYRLRNRMADAEALAKRLTDVDARLQAAARASGGGEGAAGGPARAGAPWPAAPEAQPSDDRAALEAKADILADQATRLSKQADILATRVTDLRGRQELRRRAGQLERDPFSQLEQSKRRLATSSNGAQSLNPTASAAGNQTGSPGSKDVVGTAPPPRGDTAVPAMTVSGGPSVGAPTPPPGSVGLTGQVPGAVSQAAGAVAKAQPSLVAPSASPSDSAAASVSTQFRGILDASTLAEIRRLEVAGSPSGGVPAMEHALAALRARAAQLAASADSLRNRAKLAR